MNLLQITTTLFMCAACTGLLVNPKETKSDEYEKDPLRFERCRYVGSRIMYCENKNHYCFLNESSTGGISCFKKETIDASGI